MLIDDKLTNKDAITVLRNLQDWLYLSGINGGTLIQREAIDIAIKALEAEPHWIPVTERLPEYGEEVLTITQDDVYEVNHVIDDVHDEWFWEDNGNVIAWMPLPEPYKGVTE